MIYVALPVMDEVERLPLLIESVMNQTEQDFYLLICVNQPESWWNDSEKKNICLSNRESIRYLNALNDNRIEVLDRSSPGKGWPPKGLGIGFARKMLMDHISAVANSNDIIVSMDADTVFHRGYFASVAENFRLNPSAFAVSLPYYHRLSGDLPLDRALLRYEIYMRSYAINMWRIGSPYCFTALGSAIALPVWAYRAVGGITPKLSGEDFYFLQKIVKTGKLLHWNREIVYPATRLSSRVFFGTGPALIKGITGDWGSYPIYHHSLFDLVFETYMAFNQLFDKDIPTTLDDFLLQKSGELPWGKLRKNFKSSEKFIRACHEKIDGLRILQFLKEKAETSEDSNETNLLELLVFYKNELPGLIPTISGDFRFPFSPIQELDEIRDCLFHIEMNYRQVHWNGFAVTNSFLG